jgi:hypothetical protein
MYDLVPNAYQQLHSCSGIQRTSLSRAQKCHKAERWRGLLHYKGPPELR